MTSDAMVASPKDEVVLLELIAVMAEAWKLLAFGPILIAAVVFSIFYLEPKQYEATTSIALSKVQSERLGRIEFFDDLVKNLQQVPDQPQDLAEFGRDLKISAADAAGNITIVAHRPTAAAAEALIHNVVTKALAKSDNLVPGEDVMRLEIDLAAAKENEIILRGALTKLQASVGSKEYYVREMLVLAEEIRISTVRRKNIEFALSDAEGPDLAAQVGLVKSQVRRLGTPPAVLAVLSFIATFTILLIVVFVIDAIKRGMSDPRSARSIDRIRRAFHRTSSKA